MRLCQEENKKIFYKKILDNNYTICYNIITEEINNQTREVNTMTEDMMFEELMDMGISEDFIRGAICMGGYNEDTMLRVLFYHTGYRTFEQIFAEEEEES